jgi:hypothetical protein
MEYLNNLTIYECVGLMGAGSYMLGYALLQFGIIRGRSVAYILFNMAAAALVMVSLWSAFNISAFLIQMFFFIVSIIGLTRLYLEARPVKARKRDCLIANALFPGLPLRRALGIVKQGSWIRSDGGNLTTQGKPVSQLFVIAEGAADVVMNGQKVSAVGTGGIIGDMTAFQSGTATATTTLTQHSMVFTIDAGTLKRAFARDEDLANAFEDGKQSALQQRLFQANSHLVDYKNQVA